MRILFIASQPFFEWRGSPIRVGFDTLALAELGHEVDLFVLPVGQEKQVRGVNIIRASRLPGVRRVPIGPSLVKAMYDLVMLLQGIALARRNRYDVIHAVEDAGIVALMIAFFSKSKVVFEKHSDPSSYRKSFLRNMVMWAYGKVERFTIRRADASIGTGPGLTDQIESAGGGRPAWHIPDIPSSLVEADAERTRAIGERLRKIPEEILATFVGSFAVYQGVDLLFDTIPHVVMRNPRVRFVVVGGTPAEIAERRSTLAETGSDENVTFVGLVPPDDLPDYLAASDILLSPRIAGVNTPLKLLDYMKAGRGIVATDNTANRQILDERTAVLVKPDPESLAAGVLQLAGDPMKREALGRNGRERVDRTYNFGEFKARLGKCYDGISGEHR